MFIVIRSGEHHPQNKLTDTQCLEIRALRQAGFAYTELARAYNVTPPTVRKAATKEIRSETRRFYGWDKHRGQGKDDI